MSFLDVNVHVFVVCVTRVCVCVCVCVSCVLSCGCARLCSLTLSHCPLPLLFHPCFAVAPHGAAVCQAMPAHADMPAPVALPLDGAARHLHACLCRERLTQRGDVPAGGPQQDICVRCGVGVRVRVCVCCVFVCRRACMCACVRSCVCDSVCVCVCVCVCVSVV